MATNVRHADLLLLAGCVALAMSTGCGLAAQGHNVSGVQYFQQGNYPLALTRFQEAQRTNPQNPDSYYNLAATYHKIGLQTQDRASLQQAESLYNTCLQYNPNHADCRRGLAVLLTETGRTDKAFTMLTQWATTNPQSADARVELARLSEETGNNTNAEQYLTQALQIDTGNWRAHAALGRQRELAGRYQDAMQNYQRAAQLNPYQPQLATKVQELNSKLASASLPVGSAGSTAGASGVNGYTWTNPPSSAPANIMATPRTGLGNTSASAPNRGLNY
jgi:tetratricopeptide (TPR) repeat protein